MNERQMAFASLLLALFGLAVIFLSAKGMKAKEIRIGGMGEELGNYVEISGYISSVRVSQDNVFITLCSGECATVAVFKGIAREMSEPNPYMLKKGERLIVRGEVQEYKGEPELIVIRGEDMERG